MAKGGGKGGDKTPAIICCVLVIVLLVTAGILVALSIKKLEANEVGINYSHNSLTISGEKVYESGQHAIGVGHEFITYPNNVQEIDMRDSSLIIGRTKDGLVVEIHSRLLYRLDVSLDALTNLYLMFKDRHEHAFEAIARSVIRDVAADFTAFEFWGVRDQIQTSMQLELAERLADVHCVVDTFLLASFSLPDRFQEAIDRTQVEGSKLEKVKFEEETVRRETETLIQQTQKTVETIALRANAVAESYLLEVAAESFRIEASVNAEVGAYKSLQDVLGLSPDELSTLVWLDSLKAAGDVNKVFSISSPGLVQPAS